MCVCMCTFYTSMCTCVSAMCVYNVCVWCCVCACVYDICACGVVCAFYPFALMYTSKQEYDAVVSVKCRERSYLYLQNCIYPSLKS